MEKYVALLRGINVGGNKKVPMADLKKLMEKNGYENVKTLLASGNVLFDASPTDAKKLRALLEKKFGFAIPVLLRTGKDIDELIASDPFKNVKVTPETRLYVTFFSHPPSSLAKPATGKALDILRVSETELCCVLTLDGDARTVDAMNVIEKTYGKDVTTRNWNTVLKLGR